MLFHRDWQIRQFGPCSKRCDRMSCVAYPRLKAVRHLELRGVVGHFTGQVGGDSVGDFKQWRYAVNLPCMYLKYDYDWSCPQTRTLQALFWYKPKWQIKSITVVASRKCHGLFALLSSPVPRRTWGWLYFRCGTQTVVIITSCEPLRIIRILLSTLDWRLFLQQVPYPIR